MRNFLKKKTALAAVMLTAVMLMTSAVSHDNVLIANNFIVKKGEKLIMRYFVTWGFNVISERPMEKSVKSLKITTENGTKDLMSHTKEGAIPFVSTEVDFNGLGLIEAEKDYSFITFYFFVYWLCTVLHRRKDIRHFADCFTNRWNTLGLG